MASSTRGSVSDDEKARRPSRPSGVTSITTLSSMRLPSGNHLAKIFGFLRWLTRAGVSSKAPGMQSFSTQSGCGLLLPGFSAGVASVAGAGGVLLASAALAAVVAACVAAAASES